ncbi:MAG: kynureninase [Vicinamibacteria bacterium]
MAALTRADAEALDAADPLAGVRDAFVLPDGLVYLDGNSLGALPRRAVERVGDAVAREWGEGLVSSWNDAGWIDLPARVAAKIAPLVGARPSEVAVADSTSVNLFKLLAGALRLRPGRRVIVSERGNFPTDLYVAQGLGALLGDVELRLVARDELPAALDERVALLMLTHVDFRTGEIHDMPGLTRAAQAAGALALWDLAHSAGALPVDLDGCGVDLAVGCGYKYLNGGPGAPAFAFVAEEHHARFETPLAGWMGHAAPFAFDARYAPAPGVARLLCGTPPVLSLVALECGVDTVAAAGVDRLRRKSVALGELFVRLVEQECAAFGLELASPRDPARRGSQVALRHPEAFAIVRALVARRVVGDFREPDVLRFGFAPAYLRFVDVFDAVAALRAVMDGREWARPEHRRRTKVT